MPQMSGQAPPDHKACIITGPTSGIGRASALELAEHGTVVLDTSGPTGTCYDESGHPMPGSLRVRDTTFQDRVVAETRALLSSVSA